MATDKIKELEKKLKALRYKPDKGVYGRRKVDIYNVMAFELCFSAPKKAQAIARRALAIAEKLSYTIGIVDSYCRLGVSYYMRGNYDKALVCYFEALEHSDEISDKKRIGGLYHNLGVVYSCKADYASALKYYSRAVKLRKKYGHKKELAMVHDNMGNVYRELGDLTKSLDYHIKALRVFKQIGCKREIALCHSKIGAYYNLQGEYSKALDYLLTAISFFEEYGEKRYLAGSLIDLGVTYMHLRDYDMAKELFLKSLQFAKETGHKQAIAYAYGVIGWAYKSLDQPDKSLKYAKKAYFLSEKTGNKKCSAEALAHIAWSLVEKGNYSEALEYCLKAIYYSLEINNESLLVNAYQVMGVLCKQSGRYHAALCYLRKSMESAKDKGMRELELESYLLLTELYEAQSDFENALIYYKKYAELKASVFSAEKNEYISNLKTKYETDRKEKEKEIYRLKNVKLRKEIRQRKKAEKELTEHRDQLESIVTARTAKLKATNVELKKEISERKRVEKELLSYQKQLRALAHELSLVEERQRRKIATNLHDNISQSLMIVKSNLETLAATISTKKVQKQLREIQTHVWQMIQRTRSMTFEISPPVLYELGLEPAMEWLAERFQEQHGVTCEFRDDGKVKPISDDWRSILFQSTRELLANVRKHAKANKVLVSTYRDGKYIRVTVQDDGVGFNPKVLNQKIKKNEGFGLFNLRERLTHMQGNFEIDSKKGKGTKVTLLAPLKRGKKATMRMQA